MVKKYLTLVALAASALAVEQTQNTSLSSEEQILSTFFKNIPLDAPHTFIDMEDGEIIPKDTQPKIDDFIEKKDHKGLYDQLKELGIYTPMTLPPGAKIKNFWVFKNVAKGGYQTYMGPINQEEGKWAVAIYSTEQSMLIALSGFFQKIEGEDTFEPFPNCPLQRVDFGDTALYLGTGQDGRKLYDRAKTFGIMVERVNSQNMSAILTIVDKKPGKHGREEKYFNINYDKGSTAIMRTTKHEYISTKGRTVGGEDVSSIAEVFKRRRIDEPQQRFTINAPGNSVPQFNYWDGSKFKDLE